MTGAELQQIIDREAAARYLAAEAGRGAQASSWEVDQLKRNWAEVTGKVAPKAAAAPEKPVEPPELEPGEQLATAERMAQALRRLRSAKTGEASATVAADKLPVYRVEGGA